MAEFAVTMSAIATAIDHFAFITRMLRGHS
jgi:hypothetical protein